MTVLNQQGDPQLRLQVELDGVADRLHAEFDAALGTDAVAGELTDVLSRFDEARIFTYLPVLAERETRQALRARQSVLS